MFNSDESPIRLLDIDTLNGHLSIISSNHDLVNTKLNGTSTFEKVRYYQDSVVNKALVNYHNFMDSQFHALTSLPSQQSIVSNFGQYDDQKFWQVTTDSSFTIEYDRVQMKPLKHQWHKLLGPVSLSGVDMFNLQYDCITGKQIKILLFNPIVIKKTTNVHLVITDWRRIVETLMGFLNICLLKFFDRT